MLKSALTAIHHTRQASVPLSSLRAFGRIMIWASAGSEAGRGAPVPDLRHDPARTSLAVVTRAAGCVRRVL